MTNRTRFIGYALIVLSAIASCMQDELSPPADRKPTAAEYLRRQIERKDVSLPDCRLRDGKVTKSALDIDYDVKGFTIDWTNYQSLNGKADRVWMFPMRTSTPIMGHVLARKGESVKRRATPATFKLMIIKKGKKGTSRVVTYIPEPKYLRNERNTRPEKLGWNLSGTNYSGLVLNSHLNGELVFGLKYERGRVVYRFAPRRDIANHSGQKASKAVGAKRYHLSFGLHSGKSTRASYPDGEVDDENYCGSCGMPESLCDCFDLTCSFCGNPVDECGCFTVTPDPGYDCLILVVVIIMMTKRIQTKTTMMIRNPILGIPKEIPLFLILVCQ